MRLTRAHLYLLGGFLLVLLSPVVLSQPDPNGGRGGKGKRPKMDPNTMWEQISQGKDSINVNDVQFPPEMERFGGFMRQRWSEFLQQKGITNGIMTKELYLEQSEQARQMRGAGGKGGGKGGPPGKGGSPDGKGASTADPKEEDAKIEEEARQRFTSLDVNKDGVIDREEAVRSRMSLGREFDRYDADGDGKISVEEFIEFYRDDQGRRGRGSRAVIIQGTAPPAEEDRRPVVYRAGKLPKELPQWFGLLDRDLDGQVGLYEWKAAGRPIKEFLAMDANRDGFLTAEEVLRFQKAQRKNSAGKDGRGGPGGAGVGGAGPRDRGPSSGGIPGLGDLGDGTSGTPTAESTGLPGNPTGGRNRGGAGGGNNRRSRRSPSGG